jgi:carboxymethylenebutenolidase
MRRNLFAIVLVLTLAGCSKPAERTESVTPAPEAAPSPSPPSSGPSESGPLVEFSNGGSGYLAVPPAEVTANRGAVIVIQEWWGLDDWIRENADRFAQQGYVALAVDLYRGRSTSDPGEAHELMRGLPEDRAIADLKAAFEYLASRPDVDPARIGAIGWCMGGGYALGLASAEPRLAAAVINYGRIITDSNTIAGIKPAILGNFAGADRGIPNDSVQAFDQALDKAGVENDIRIYEGKAHAFMNPNNKEGYDAAAAEDAWKRIDAFLARRLTGAR